MDPVRIASRLTAAGVLCAAVVFGLIGSATVVATAVETNDATHFDFFESQVRPLLVNRCYECHSGIAVWNQADLRLDSRDAILKGGKSGPAIILGKPNESRLIEYVQHRGKIKMPKGRPKLSDSEIVSLVKWVELGAPWPKIEPKLSGDEYDWEKARQHWAFQPIRKQEGSVDQFISNGLKTAGLKSPPQAQSSIFVRRAFLDLIGLPPTPAELQRWSDRLDDEFDQTTVLELVNDLLSRPQYGERWGRHWLDVARYSDAGGWTQDNRPTPSAWQYRDWVVRAFNKDLPYNDFVRHQIYGDYIDSDAAIGTGFFALGPSYMSDGGAPEGLAQAKAETLDDRVDTFSRGFLGLTLSCARCHDHKFDAIPIVDYYSIAGIFSNSGEGERPLARGEEIKAYHDYFKPIYELHRRIGKHREDAATENRPVSQEEQSQIDAWEKEAKKLESEAPPKYAFAHTLHDRSSEDMHVALRGNLLKRGPLAPRRFLRVLSHLETGDGYSEGSGRRSLAESVVSPNNPLTARVLVNRLWLHHFGKALVRTPDNFGVLGEPPTHPVLLDWLAAKFIESGWSIKAMHRLIMTSEAYRASSAFDQEAFERDADNRLIWRMNPRRMEVESWRDSLLAATGELETTIGGPPVDDIARSNRRTLYAKVSRNDPLASDAFLRLFDFPIPRASSAKRTADVMPQQFLFMLNSPFMLERAKALALRLERDAGPDRHDQIMRAYSLLYGRLPTDGEIGAAHRFLKLKSTAKGELTRWQQYCQAILSANEFIYIR
ncbi:MAG: PSD1 and planctomycete cytochrome C domain-containing protein [Verrucomicrobiales bacterium]|jgi:hypothetical protein|nr:PSD1 and planctomycete cytochrome C domain-containing protein [Verrucomicrobiales bacterium]